MRILDLTGAWKQQQMGFKGKKQTSICSRFLTALFPVRRTVLFGHGNGGQPRYCPLLKGIERSTNRQ